MSNDSVISLESHDPVVCGQVKAALRTLSPAEQKLIEDEPKVSKDVRQRLTGLMMIACMTWNMLTPMLLSYACGQLLYQNIVRVRRCVMVLFNLASFINSCFQWESTQRSLIAFLVSTRKDALMLA